MLIEKSAPPQLTYNLKITENATYQKTGIKASAAVY